MISFYNKFYLHLCNLMWGDNRRSAITHFLKFVSNWKWIPLSFIFKILLMWFHHTLSLIERGCPGFIMSFKLLITKYKHFKISSLVSVACDKLRYFRMFSGWFLLVIFLKFMTEYIPSFSELNPITFFDPQQ